MHWALRDSEEFAMRVGTRDNMDVFPAQMPDGLRPERNIGHAISQVAGSKPVFGPMYRLSPKQKLEVERQVTV
ncbi:hypothetical protein WJX77_001129 [Trebouxia sp. C0004]